MPNSTNSKFTDKTLIIFDWDGTLMDSIGLIVESMHMAGQSVGMTTTDVAIKSIIGLSLARGIELLYPQADADQQSHITQAYAEHYIANSHTSPLFAGVPTLLEQLRNQGKLLAVATGKKRVGLERVFAHSGIKGQFVTSRCADESGSKPDPAMLSEILAETGKTVVDSVFVGDSIHDIEMANALGMDSIAVSYGTANKATLLTAHPTAVVDDVKGLAGLLL